MNVLFRSGYDVATLPCLQFCPVAISDVAVKLTTQQLKLQNKVNYDSFYYKCLIHRDFVLTLENLHICP